MAKTNDIDRHIRDNPQVDAEQMREAGTLIAELRKQGLQRPEFNLSMPYENGLRRLRARCECATDCPPAGRRSV